TGALEGEQSARRLALGTDRRQRENRSRGADRLVEADAANALSDLRRALDHQLAAVNDGADVWPLLQIEALRETERSEWLARREVDLVGRPDDHLRAAAADVDTERRARSDVDGGAHCAKDVVGLFLAGDHADFDAGVVADALQEIAAVRRFTHRARRDGDDLVRFPAPRDLRHLRDRVDAAVDGIFGQRLAVETGEAELHHLLFPVHHSIAAAPRLGHDHVNRVRA